LGVYGPLTAQSLRSRGLHPVAVAADHKTPLILDALRQSGLRNGQRFLVLRGEEVLEQVPEALRALGAQVDVAACFGLEPDLEDRTGAAATLAEQGAEWIVFASGQAIEHFHHRFNLPDLHTRFPQLKIALAGPALRWALERLGLQPSVVAQPNDPVSLTTEMILFEAKQLAAITPTDPISQSESDPVRSFDSTVSAPEHQRLSMSPHSDAYLGSD
jgi:uroporphyrinogen III methyltransferase/synthase